MQTRKNTDVLKQTLNLKGSIILDIGCGDGQLGRYIAKNGAYVVGLESSTIQLKKAKALQNRLALPLVLALGQTLPFKDQSFDILVFFNSLHHIPTELHAQCFKEAQRILKDQGLIYISEPIAEGPNFELLKPVDDETKVRAEAYRSILACEPFGFKMGDEKIYNHPVKRKSYEDMKDSLLGPNPDRAKLFIEKDLQLRALYNQLGQNQEDGSAIFHQPTRMNLIYKN